MYRFFKIFIFCLFVISAAPANAQQEYIDLTKIEPVIDFSSALSYEDFVLDSELYEEAPLSDQYLAYQVRLPRFWHRTTDAEVAYQASKLEAGKNAKRDRKKKKGEGSKTETSLSPSVLGLVAKYYGPGRIEAPSKFEIEAQKLDYDVTAKNWFMQETLIRGYSLQGLTVHSDSKVEAQFVVVIKGEPYVVRSVAQINGTRMVVASYYVPDIFWEKERAHQQKVIESFKFLTPQRSKIETTRVYAFLDLLTMEYPASWRLIAPNIFSIEGMEATLIHSVDQQTVNGEIHISIVSTEFESALSDEIKYVKEELRNRELEVGDLIETRKDYKLNDHLHYAHVEAYNAIGLDKKLLDHEYWLGVLEEDRYYYVVTMLTPGRKTDFYTWARNAEAFETVLESFRL